MSQDAGLVSVIIPCFNGEKYIALAVQSCIRQTYQNIEIIIVDDGSSDNSVMVVRSFKDPRIKLIQQKNLGACEARNRGIKESKGKWIQFLDQDDFISSNKIEEQLKILCGREDFVAICPTVNFIDGTDPGKITAESPKFFCRFTKPADFLISLWGGMNESDPVHFIQTNSWLCPTNLVVQAGFWDQDCFPDDDIEFFCRLVLRSNGVCCTEGAVNYHRTYKIKKNIRYYETEKEILCALRSVSLQEMELFKKDSGRYARIAVAKCYARILRVANGVSRKAVDAAILNIQKLGEPVIVTRGIGGRMAPLVEKVFGVAIVLVYYRVKSALSRILN